jgi:glucoamylase
MSSTPRSTVLVNVTFQSLTGRPYQVYAYVDPSLTNNGMDDSGTCDCGQLLASEGHTASAVLATPSFAQTSCGYLSTSDGWTQLQSGYRLRQYTSAPDGNVVETARLKVDGVGQQHATLAVGFGGTTADALTAAQGHWRLASRPSPRPTPAAGTPTCPPSSHRRPA